MLTTRFPEPEDMRWAFTHTALIYGEDSEGRIAGLAEYDDDGRPGLIRQCYIDEFLEEDRRSAGVAALAYYLKALASEEALQVISRNAPAKVGHCVGVGYIGNK